MDHVQSVHAMLVDAVRRDGRRTAVLATVAGVRQSNLCRYLATGGKGLGTDAFLRVAHAVGLTLTPYQRDNDKAPDYQVDNGRYHTDSIAASSDRNSAPRTGAAPIAREIVPATPMPTRQPRRLDPRAAYKGVGR